MILELLAEHRITPVKAGNKDGGEYHSACPGCGDGGKGRQSNRFHCWPEQNEGKGSYWCRQCKSAGDAIQFLMDFNGMDFRSAAEFVGKDLTAMPAHRLSPEPKKTKQRPEWTPKPAADPAELWREKVEKTVARCHEKLLENTEQLSYLAGRGLTRETVVKHRLGWNPKDTWRPRESWGLETILVKDEKTGRERRKKLWLPAGIVIPHVEDNTVVGIKIRRPSPRNPEKPKYYELPGSFQERMLLGKNRDVYVLIEAELDALLVYQESGDVVGVCALGSASKRPAEKTAPQLAAALHIVDALDYDGAGAKEKDFWSTNYPQTHRWPVPVGKDPGEAFAAGVNIREWILAGLPPRWQLRCRPKPEPAPAPPIQQKAAPAPAAPENPGLPAEVVELARLMRPTPVTIVTHPKRLGLDYPLSWMNRNFDTFARISDLVFQNKTVFDHINRLPYGRYTGRNLARI